MLWLYAQGVDSSGFCLIRPHEIPISDARRRSSRDRIRLPRVHSWAHSTGRTCRPVRRRNGSLRGGPPYPCFTSPFDPDRGGFDRNRDRKACQREPHSLPSARFTYSVTSARPAHADLEIPTQSQSLIWSSLRRFRWSVHSAKSGDPARAQRWSVSALRLSSAFTDLGINHMMVAWFSRLGGHHQ